VKDSDISMTIDNISS